MEKNLKYFMNDDAAPETVTVKGLERFKDEDGNVIPFEIKVLSQEKISGIYKKYTEKKIAHDKRGNPIISANNEIAHEVNKDYDKAARHIIVEALVFPDLTDEDLMKSYDCYDITEMPLKVFKKSDEYNYVAKVVMEALGMGSYGLDEDELVDEAKK